MAKSNEKKQPTAEELALDRLSKMAAAGTRPDRMVGEVASIAAAWSAEASYAASRERLEGLWHAMANNVEAVESDLVDSGEKPGKAALRTLDALRACRDALEAEQQRQAA